MQENTHEQTELRISSEKENIQKTDSAASLFLSAYCCRIFLFLLCSYFSGKARTRAYGNLHFPTAPLQFKEPPELAVSHSKDKAAAFHGRAAEIDYGTYVIPGLTSTRTQIFGEKGSSDLCISMTPQGLAVTEDYLLVSAYCHSGTHNSVIYVIDKKTHEFIKELVLRNKSHVGGLAYDPIHHNIWISGMSRGIPQVNAITLEQLEEYSFQEEYQPIVYSQSYDLYAITRTSFITYHDNALYVGYFTQNTASVLEEYDIAEDGTLITQVTSDTPDFVDSLTPIALPSDMRVITEQAQGVAFYKDKILFSHSYGIFPSTLQVFKNNSFQKLLEKIPPNLPSAFLKNWNRFTWMGTICMYCLNPPPTAIGQVLW